MAAYAARLFEPGSEDHQERKTQMETSRSLVIIQKIQHALLDIREIAVTTRALNYVDVVIINASKVVCLYLQETGVLLESNIDC